MAERRLRNSLVGCICGPCHGNPRLEAADIELVGNAITLSGNGVVNAVAHGAVRLIVLSNAAGLIDTIDTGTVAADQALALDSRCRLADGTEMHLPMMDFRVLSRGGDVSSISTSVQVVGEERGVILRSGRSYHYYGLRPLNHEDWYRFYARCLLLSPITDSRYIAHRLLSGAASLRITPSKLKPFTPKVSALVGSV